MAAWLQAFSDLVFSQALLALFLCSGLWYSLRSGFLQVRLLKPMLLLLRDNRGSAQGISSFQAFCTALAGRIGTGNIAGTAAAIYLGGPGSLFWLVLLAFFNAATAFVEATLAQIWKTRLDGEYRGGPAYYIARGLGIRWYANLFAIVTLLACGVFLPCVQANVVAAAFDNALALDPLWVGLALALLLFLIIVGGIRRIAQAAEILVPVMAAAYLLMTLLIILCHLDRLGPALALILRSAFGQDAVFGGALGAAVIWGMRRGIYANEAGQGSAPHTAATAETRHPAEQGLVQAFSIYVDSLLICASTGLMIIITDCFNTVSPDGQGFLHIGRGAAVMADYAAAGIAGPEFTQAAVDSLFPGFGAIFVAVCLVFFAFTSLLAFYYQAESNINFLCQAKSPRLRQVLTNLFRLCFIGVVFVAANRSAGLAWAAGDIGVGLMSWLNLTALLFLQNPALRCLRDYERQLRRGLVPRFEPWCLGIKDAELWRQLNQ